MTADESYFRGVIDGFVCRGCSQRHDGLPFSYSSATPTYWLEDLGDDERSVLDGEIYIIAAQRYSSGHGCSSPFWMPTTPSNGACGCR